MKKSDLPSSMCMQRMWEMCLDEQGRKAAWCRAGNGAVVKLRVYDFKNVTQIASFLLLMCF